MQEPAQVDGPLLIAPELIKAGELLIVQANPDLVFTCTHGASNRVFRSARTASHPAVFRRSVSGFRPSPPPQS